MTMIKDIDYVRVYGWEPCSNGCSGNGCCDSSSETCKCNAGWFGSNCEFNYGIIYLFFLFFFLSVLIIW